MAGRDVSSGNKSDEVSLNENAQGSLHHPSFSTTGSQSGQQEKRSTEAYDRVPGNSSYGTKKSGQNPSLADTNDTQWQDSLGLSFGSHFEGAIKPASGNESEDDLTYLQELPPREEDSTDPKQLLSEHQAKRKSGLLVASNTNIEPEEYESMRESRLDPDRFSTVGAHASNAPSTYARSSRAPSEYEGDHPEGENEASNTDEKAGSRYLTVPGASKSKKR